MNVNVDRRIILLACYSRNDGVRSGDSGIQFVRVTAALCGWVSRRIGRLPRRFVAMYTAARRSSPSSFRLDRADRRSSGIFDQRRSSIGYPVVIPMMNN